MPRNPNAYYRKPNPFYYGILTTASKFISKFCYNLEVLRNDLKGKQGKCVIIANHESNIDFYPAFSVVPKNTHVVASNSIMRSMPIFPVVEACGVIIKNQFQTNPQQMRKMKAVLDHDEALLLYPAGLMTESGASTPIPIATGKVLKWFDADIYVAKVSGTYLTKPKWAKVKRKGKITMDLYHLISREDLSKLTVEETDALIGEHLSFDAYRINEKQQVPFKNGDNVEGLENVLYQCPSCGQEFSIQVNNGNTLCCSSCGYSATSDQYGILSSADTNDLIYRYPSDWHNHIEHNVYENIKKDPSFCMTTHAQIHKINDKKHRYEPVGSGNISLDYDKFVIDASIDQKPFFQEISTESFPILPFVPGERFEIQCGNDIFRIVPDDGKIVMKWIFTLKATYRLKHNL